MRDQRDQTLTLQEAEVAIAELRALAKDEYGVELEQLFFSGNEEDAMRLVRLSGILVKRPFAVPEECEDYSGNLGASKAWYWNVDKLNDPAREQLPEYQLLEQVRLDQGMEKNNMLGIAQEAGLMYVVGRWLYGKVTEDEARSFVDLYYEEKSKETELAISAANLLPVAGMLAGVTGIPALGVSLAMLLVQYGFEKMTAPEARPDE